MKMVDDSSVRRSRVTIPLLVFLFTCLTSYGCSESDDTATLRDGSVSADTNVNVDVSSPAEDQGLVQESGVEDLGRGPDAALDVTLADATPTDLDGSPVVADAGPIDLGLSRDGGAAPDADLINCEPPLARYQFSTWPIVVGPICSGCHISSAEVDGPAQEGGSDFVLSDPTVLVQGQDEADVHAHNLEQIVDFATDVMGEPLLIEKALGRRGHGGMAQVVDGSPEHEELVALLDLVTRVEAGDCVQNADDVPNYSATFGRLTYRNMQETYRAFTIQTLGRLPTTAEVDRIENGRPGEGPMIGMPGDRAENNGRNEGDPNVFPPVAVSNQKRVLSELLTEQMARREFRPWLKDGWNNAFLFRGIYAQELDRAYEALHGKDFAARTWADFCDWKMPQVDENGEYINNDEHQPACHVLHQDFNYVEVGQPNFIRNDDGYEGMPVLSPVDACDFCALTRYGISHWVKFGVTESPLELIASTIQEGRPFSEILTTEDIMMNYYSSLAFFGTADPAINPFTADMGDVPWHNNLKSGDSHIRFDVRTPDHRVFKRVDGMRRTYVAYRTLSEEDYPEVRFSIPSIRSRARPSFPRAGLLSHPAFFKRYPSNEFNLNRHRAWQAMRLFLGFDILNNQGARLSLAGIENPNGDTTVDNAECSRCHSVLDPIAGLFKDFHYEGYSLDVDPDDDPWPASLYPPGTASVGPDEIIHDRERDGPPIQLLGRAMVADPRFATAMVNHAWLQVFGHPPLTTLGDLEGLALEARRILLVDQRRFIASVVEGFVSRDFDMAWVYRRLFTSKWYRIKALKPHAEGAPPNAAYDGVGRHGTVTPEEYFRKLTAIYGGPWPLRSRGANDDVAGNREEKYARDFFTRIDSLQSNFNFLFGILDDNFSAFLGGIDFENSLTRAEQMESIMSLTSKRVAYESACLITYRDLRKPVEERRFFVEVPEFRLVQNPVARDDDVVRNIIYLFKLFLGRDLDPEDPEIGVVTDLWHDMRQAVLDDIAETPTARRLALHCGLRGSAERDEHNQLMFLDPDGQVRAWMGVVSYLMLQPEFLQR
jgi:hypothetical protein